jgi:biofilm PGA synthesis N-glycosyltransferase PgaC
VLLLASVGLSLGGRRSYEGALVVQAGFYALAILGFGLDRLRIRVPFLSLPYAFTLLNLAAAASPFRMLAGRERAAWKASGS